MVVVILITVVLLIPVLTVATSLVNWIITLLVKPRILPKLDFRKGIPEPFQTLVVIPAMITSHEEINSLVQQLELHYLRNPEPGLRFALLTDFPDASSEKMPEDEDLVQNAAAAINSLNKKYENSHSNEDMEAGQEDEPTKTKCSDTARRFYFLHRKRIWNPFEGKWMGWERKRGKLHELNLLLRGAKNLSFTTLNNITGSSKKALERVRFVITLDADTILPNGAACRLAGTLAHPLNQAVFDETSGEVVSGYTILQPRMEIHREGPIIPGSRAFMQVIPGWICTLWRFRMPTRICLVRAATLEKEFMMWMLSNEACTIVSQKMPSSVMTCLRESWSRRSGYRYHDD